jgi:hypothetical protein
MKSLLCVLAAALFVCAMASPTYAIGRRSGGNMMVCNAVAAEVAPPTATAANLVPTTALRVFNPLSIESKPVIVAKAGRSGVDMTALHAINNRPTQPEAPASPGRVRASQVASK